MKIFNIKLNIMMDAKNINLILSKYLKIQKNITIFSKVLSKLDEEIVQQVIYELCVDLKSKKSIKECYKKLISNKYIYGANEFEEYRIKQQEQDEFLTTPIEVEEGVLECHCGSKKTVSFTLQTRSGDEGTDVWARCVVCNTTWKA